MFSCTKIKNVKTFFIFTQLSLNAVSTLQKVWVLTRLSKQHNIKACM